LPAATRRTASWDLGLFVDHNVSRNRVDQTLARLNRKLGASELKLVLRTLSWRVESAPPVVAMVHKRGKVAGDALHGRYEAVVGVEAFFRREVRPHVPGALIDPDGTKIGFEISFTRHFDKPKGAAE
jgi:type I restriction enzyme M protein